LLGEFLFKFCLEFPAVLLHALLLVVVLFPHKLLLDLADEFAFGSDEFLFLVLPQLPFFPSHFLLDLATALQ
jgi:hypothetical protein